MVERRRAIHLAAARAKVEHDGTNTEAVGLSHQSRDIVRPRRPFQAVENQDQTRVGIRRVEPVEIEEITVACLEALPPKTRRGEATKEGTPECLEVAAAVPPRWMILGGLHLQGSDANYSWPWRSSFTISGAISRARWSS